MATANNPLGRHARAAAAAVDRHIGDIWRRLLVALGGVRTLGDAFRLALAWFRHLAQTTRRVAADSLLRVAVASRREAARGLLRQLPEKALLRAAAQNPRVLPHIAGHLPSGQPVAFIPHEKAERFTPLPQLRLLPAPEPEPAGRIEVPALTNPPATKEEFAALLFSSPRREEVQAHLDRMLAAVQFPGGHRWPPEKLARVVADSYAAGKNVREIARDVLPAVDNVRASALRVARTWSLYVGHEEQMAVHEELGEMVVGYRLLSACKENSRPWHCARHGTIYYRHPGPGQKGFAQMPRPPLEPADPAERPAGTPHVAWNCLCALVPVLAPV